MASHPNVSEFAQRQDLLRQVIATCSSDQLEGVNTRFLGDILIRMNQDMYRLNGLVWELEERIKELEQSMSKEAF